MAKVLCLDPGLNAGAAVVFDDDGRIITKHTWKYTSKESRASRLGKIYRIIDLMAAEANVEVVVSEKQFHNSMSIAGAVGEIVAGNRNLEYVAYYPTSWKLKATGSGKTNDNLLFKVVNDIFPLTVFTEHEVDCVGMFLAYKKEKS